MGANMADLGEVRHDPGWRRRPCLGAAISTPVPTLYPLRLAAIPLASYVLDPRLACCRLSLCFMLGFRWVASAMSFPVWVAWLLLASTASCRAQTPVPDPKLGAGIREALVAGGDVNVMVALATRASGEDSASVARAIAEAQDAVLTSLDSSDFHLRRRYAAVPAFSGTLRSVLGLDRLLAHPLVRRVDRDPGGTGVSSEREAGFAASGARIPESSQTSRRNPSQ